MATFQDTATQQALWSTTEDSPDGGEWETPQDFFNKLNDEFHFTFDAAATLENTKCLKYFTKEQDALLQEWPVEIIFCNPPYGRQIGEWLKKGREAASKGATVVFLIHARTDTRWFHTHVYNIATEIRFIKGRLKFEHKNGRRQSAPFPSMVVIYRPT